MTPSSYPLAYTQSFIDELSAVVNWLDSKSSMAAQKFVAELYGLIHSRIAKYPESFMEYPWKRTPQKFYRRAVFKKNWYLVFKFDGIQVEFLVLYHSKRDPKNIEL